MSRHPRRLATATVLSLLAGLVAVVSIEAQRRDPSARPRAPRIPPLESAESSLNVVKTLAQHPALSEAWLPFGGYVLRDSTLPPRDRELLILRTAWLCQAEYEWGHHARLARSVGLSDEEISRVRKGPQAGGWSSFDRGLLRAADQLHRDAFVNDHTWGTLKARYSDQQMMDVVFTVGEYTLVSMALNSFGVQREEGVGGFPQDGP